MSRAGELPLMVAEIFDGGVGRSSIQGTGGLVYEGVATITPTNLLREFPRYWWSHGCLWVEQKLILM